MTHARHPGLQLLDSLPEWSGRERVSPEPARRVAEELGNPQDRVRTIHVAGTNGKGSVCSYLAAILSASGAQVGQYASPHLVDVTERCLVNGKPVEAERLGEAVLRVAEIGQLLRQPLSYFEIVTLASFLVFAESGLDWTVIEVGLGGRLDATNILSAPVATVITTIDYDHVDVLGSTLNMIAREKGGIFKPNVRAFVGDAPDEAFRALRECAETIGNEIEFWGREFRFDRERRTVVSQDGEVALPETLEKDGAEYQLKNAALATRVAQAMGIDELAIRRGLSSARWPGRVELLRGLPEEGEFLLDVAHNLQGIGALISYLRRFVRLRPELSQLIVFFGALERKDWRGMIDLLAEFEDELRVQRRASVRWVFSSSGDRGSVPPGEFVSYLHRGEGIEDVVLAFDRIRALASREPTTLTIVTGSIYFVGRVRPLISGAGEFRTIAPPSPASWG